MAYRLDPFRNIVNVSLGGTYVLFCFQWQDQLTTNLGERCTLINNTPGELQNAFTAGVQSRVFTSDYITVDYDPNTFTDGSLLNGDNTGQPSLVTTETQTLGYAKFPSCFNCLTSAIRFNQAIWWPSGDPSAQSTNSQLMCPPGDDPAPVYADPVAFNTYQKSFLFELAASDRVADNPTAGSGETTRIDFDIFGIPNPKEYSYHERTLPTYPGGPPPPPEYFEESITQGSTGFNWRVYVFNKSAVDLFLSDQVFPLRKTGGGSVDETKAIAKATISDQSIFWVDPENMMHEPLNDESAPTGGGGTFNEGSTGDATIRLSFHFEKFMVGPGLPSLPGTNVTVQREIAWPKEPAATTVFGKIGGSGTDANIVIRNYLYTWLVNGQTQSPDTPPPHDPFRYGSPPQDDG